MAIKKDAQRVTIVEFKIAKDNETREIRVSSHSINPNRTENWYDPRLAGTPNLTREKQEIFYGKTRVSFGNISIDIADGRWDEYVTDWSFNGQEVTVRQGTSEQNISDYPIIFTGLMGQPSHNDYTLTIPVRDKQINLFDRVYPKTEKEMTLDAFVKSCIKIANISSINQASYDAWNAVDGAKTIRLDTVAGTAVSKVMDDVLAPMATWYGFNRSGEFVISNFKLAEPTDVPVYVLANDTHILDGSFSTNALDRQYWRVKVGWVKTPKTSTADEIIEYVSKHDGKYLTASAATNLGTGLVGIPVDSTGLLVGDRVYIVDTQNYNGEYGVKAVQSGRITVEETYVAETFTGKEVLLKLTNEAISKDGLEYESRLRSEAHATEIAERWHTILSIPRTRVIITMKTNPVISIGDIIQLSRPRFFTEKNMTIYKYVEDYANNTLQIEALI